MAAKEAQKRNQKIKNKEKGAERQNLKSTKDTNNIRDEINEEYRDSVSVDTHEHDLVREISNNIGEYQYSSGGSDDGKLREYVDRMADENNCVYTGEVLKGTKTKDGKGVLRWPDGSKYEGHFLDNMANGKGRLIMSSGDVYDGEWANDKMHGYGEYAHANGTYYEGEWDHDQQNGYGKEKFPDGSHYAGYYRNGQ